MALYMQILIKETYLLEILSNQIKKVRNYLFFKNKIKICLLDTEVEVILLDHGLYKELTNKMRLDYARLWKSIIL